MLLRLVLLAKAPHHVANVVDLWNFMKKIGMTKTKHYTTQSISREYKD
jgi:hypothetical protein